MNCKTKGKNLTSGNILLSSELLGLINHRQYNSPIPKSPKRGHLAIGDFNSENFEFKF